MAITRLSLETLKDQIRVLIGEPDAARSRVADSNTSTDKASLAQFISSYNLVLPQRLALLAQEIGSGNPYPGFWRTRVNSTTTAATANLVVAAGSQTVNLPDDYLRYISFYDRTNSRPIYTTQEVARWHVDRLRKKPEGPPEAIEILGVDSGSRWEARLWPPTGVGVTPSLELTYWRMPANMPDTTPASEYPDAPPEFHFLWVIGPITLLLATDDPAWSRFREQERELLTQMLRSADAY